MKRRCTSLKRASVSVWILLVLLAAPLCGQTGAGAIQGTVTDAQGAVVPGANVTLTQTAAMTVRTTTTNAVGFYLFPSTFLGPYEVKVEAPGMETWKGTVNLRAGQIAEIDVKLAVSTTRTEVTVVGNVTPLVTTTNATLGGTLERERIEQLPLNGRYLGGLISMTTPGMENAGASTTSRLFGLWWATEFLQDGAVIQNRYSGGYWNRPPGVDSIAEFQTETNNSSAKMNRPGTVIMSTRSGGNAFHGSAFETNRNSGFGVARKRTDYYAKPPHMVRNEFGASAGGPVFLPKLYNGTNKTFFFFAYEAYRNMSSSTGGTSMATEAMRNGDYSGLVDSQGRLYTIYDPLTTQSAATNYLRTPFANNRIPLERESPLTKYLYSVTPLPTLANVNPMVASNYFGIKNSTTRDYTFTTRVDHRLSDRDQLFGRLSHTQNIAAADNSSYNSGNPPTTDGSANRYTAQEYGWSGVTSYMHTFSPTFFSETLATFSRQYSARQPAQIDPNFDKTYHMPNPFSGAGIPIVPATGFNMTYDQSSTMLFTSTTQVLNIDQNFTKVHGRHEFLFGGRLREEWLPVLPGQQIPAGQVNFNAVPTALYDPRTGTNVSGSTPYTGHTAASFFMGYASSFAAWYSRNRWDMRSGERSGYFQDNFKVNSRLTLNFGVRYEYFTTPVDVNGVMSSFDPGTHTIALGLPAEQFAAGGGTTMGVVNAMKSIGGKFDTFDNLHLPKPGGVNPDPWNFGPRAGFAYRLTQGNRPLVLRGGYSIFTSPDPLNNSYEDTRTSAPQTGQFSTDLNLAATSPDGLPNALIRSAPTVIAGVNAENMIDITKPGGIARGSVVVKYFNPDQPATRSHQWNLTFEKEIARNIAVKFGYVGTHGSRYTQDYDMNNPPNDYIWYTTTHSPKPTGPMSNVATRPYDQSYLGTVRELRKIGWSNASSWQLEFQRRYAHGVGFQVYYVLSNANRAGAFGWHDQIILTPANYLPNAVPDDINARVRLLNYSRDSTVPKHRVNYNWVVDLPVGRGKLLAHNAGRLVDSVIGGWQLAGNGSVYSQWWDLPTSNWGSLGNVEVYGTKYPVENCTSGTCYQGYLYWNGYIPANRINSYDPKTGKPNGIMGVPSNYTPSSLPIFPTPANGGSSSDPNYAWYETNTVWIPLNNGQIQRTTMNTNMHPWNNQYFRGPFRWNLNASLFKSARITERVFMRLNVDFFNVMNNPGMGVPGDNGFLSLQSSANSPRNLQLTLRLTW